jgi:hypothetical protein
VRDTVPLDLKEGVNDVSFADTTAHLEPDSVILRDPSGKVNLQVLEQNYRNDPVSQELLLSLFEGKTIDFLVKEDKQAGPDHPGENHPQRLCGSFAGGDAAVWAAVLPIANGYANGGTSQPIIEVDGKIQFGLPGQPIFPSLGDDTILKPRFRGSSPPTRPASLMRSSPTSPAA